MANDMATKLKIKEGYAIFPINAPSNFKKNLGPLPAKAKLTEDPKNCDQIHWFVLNREQMENELNRVLRILRPDVTLWIYYPKGSSKLQTDLNRDKGWEELMKHDLQWLSLISFDDTWSAFAARLKNEVDRKKEAQQPEKKREIFDYIDPAKKTVRLPDDFETVLKKNKKLEKFFNELSFTNRKEYVEWIVTAKRPETRAERVKGSMERLEKGWKNPRNM